MEKYCPKNICPTDNTIIWNYNITTERVKCTKCGLLIEKKLHGIIGAELSKDEKGHYVLEFKEFKERDVYSSWGTLREELDRLAENEDKSNIIQRTEKLNMEGK